MKTQVVQIIIRRSLTSAPADVVLAHEVPILKVIRGSGNITVTDEDCGDCALKPRKVKARDEFIKLKQKYKGFVVDGQHPVDVAFPDGSRDLELFYKDPSVFDAVGEEAGGGVLEDETEDEILDDEGNVVSDETPEAEPDVVGTEDPIDPSTFQGVNLLDRPSVLAALDKAEVPYAKTTATKHLATLLANSLEQQGAE